MLLCSALFDDDEESGSDAAMDVDEFPASKSKSAGKASTAMSKYAKKAAGFTDDNSEWLTLKKEVRLSRFTTLFRLPIATMVVLSTLDMPKPFLTPFKIHFH